MMSYEHEEDSFLPPGWKRQAFQSLMQFMGVLLAGLATRQTPPETFSDLWPHLIAAAVVAVGIWATSKANIGGPERRP